MDRNDMQQRFVLFRSFIRLLVEGYKGLVNARRRAQKIVSGIHAGDVSIYTIDAGKDIQISAGFLESILEILAEDCSGEKTVIGNAQQILALAIVRHGYIKFGECAIFPDEASITVAHDDQ